MYKVAAVISIQLRSARSPSARLRHKISAASKFPRRYHHFSRPSPVLISPRPACNLWIVRSDDHPRRKIETPVIAADEDERGSVPRGGVALLSRCPRRLTVSVCIRTARGVASCAHCQRGSRGECMSARQRRPGALSSPRRHTRAPPRVYPSRNPFACPCRTMMSTLIITVKVPSQWRPSAIEFPAKRERTRGHSMTFHRGNRNRPVKRFVEWPSRTGRNGNVCSFPPTGVPPSPGPHRHLFFL